MKLRTPGGARCLRRVRTLTCVFALLGAASFVTARTAETPAHLPPATSAKEADRPIPISFRAAPLRFVADGREHGPTILVLPSAATYTVEGMPRASAPGEYRVTVIGSGAYTGRGEFTWTIAADPVVVRREPSGGGQLSPSRNGVPKSEVRPFRRPTAPTFPKE